MLIDITEIEKTKKIASNFANLIQNNKTFYTFYLNGNLGAGKTTFVKFCLEALGWEGKVKSPTFGLIEEYHLQSIKLIHTDLYRLNSSDEFDYFGVDLDFQSHGAIFIEWPEKIEKFNCTNEIDLRFENSKSKRVVKMPGGNRSTCCASSHSQGFAFSSARSTHYSGF